MDSSHLHLLKSVSRTFALSLQFLPVKQKAFVGLCYLIARYGDTIADAGRLEPAARASLLAAWLKALHSPSAEAWLWKESVGSFSPEEAKLLLEGQGLLVAFHAEDSRRKDIALELFEALFKGMQTLIAVRARATEDTPIFVHRTKAELDWYCHSHAGVVGRFWNQIFDLPEHLEAFALSYGKALERINIIRDLEEDRKLGLLLLDQETLKEFKLETSRPWDEENWPLFMDRFVTETRKFLFYGAQYVDSIPFSEFRLRFSSQMPLRLGYACLSHFRVNPRQRPRLSREEVRKHCVKAGFSVIRRSALSKEFKTSKGSKK